MKKNVLLVITIMLSTIITSAQDIIVKTTQEDIKSKVFTIKDQTGIYKIITAKSDDKPNKQTSYVNTNNNQSSQNDEYIKPTIKKYKGTYFVVGAGYGNSYGGAGFRAQFRVGRKVGFGLHAGLGLSPFSAGGIGGSLGVKFFPYKGLYLNTQIGLIGTKKEKIYNYNSNDGYTIKDDLPGVAIMVGIDQIWGDKVGIGFNVAIGPAISLKDETVLPVFDLGFLIRF